MAITYYYPEGPLGPICDIFIDDADDGIREEPDDGDGRAPTYGPVDYGGIESVIPDSLPFLTGRRCRVRTLADGTEEYYDCVDDLTTPIGTPIDYPLIEPQYDWESVSTSWGINDEFEPLKITPEMCSSADPDVNIIPVKFFKADGTFVEKTQVERSNPVTFPVSDGTPSTIVTKQISASFVDTGGGLSARFLSDGTGIQVDGTGTGTITLDFEWDDRPSISGQSVGSLTIGGQTFSQGSSTEGDQTRTLSVTGGNSYLWTISGQNSDAGFIISDDGQTIQWDDDASNGFDVNSTLRIRSLTGTGNSVVLRVTGTESFTGQIGLSLEWDDNPNTNGSALGTVVVAGQTFTQRGSKGSQDTSIEVTTNTDYPLAIDGGSGEGGPGDGASGLGGYEVSSQSICFYDLDGTDCNATLRITGQVPAESEPGPGAWNDDADKYAVWVNPEVCTLPTLQQTVTYFIDIPETDNYTITGGADDEFQVYLNDSSTPVIGGPAGIFEEEHERHHTGNYTPPYSATVPLTKGTLKMVVTCTNGSTENDEDGNPTGSAFKWYYNPGGWYIKICRGNNCIESTSIDWVHSGPNGGGHWSEFMDKYAVYPSNSDVLLNTDHSATYNILVPFAGNYELEWGMDDAGTISLDGTQIVSSGYEPNSQTYTINNLTAGPHTIGVTIRNNGPSGDWIANPGGIAWTLTPVSSSNVSVIFDSDGNIVTTGDGTVEVEFLFEWDDNPNSYDQALGTVTWANIPGGSSGLEFTQTRGVSSGSDDDTVVLYGNTTYNIQVFNNTGGYSVQDNGTKICFRDNDGNDCNAEVRIGTINQTVTNPDIVASSLDLQEQNTEGNLIWHTRKATGYKYVEIT